MFADLRFRPFLAVRKAGGKIDAVSAHALRNVLWSMVNLSDADGGLWYMPKLFAAQAETSTRMVERVMALLLDAGLAQKDEGASRGWAPLGESRNRYCLDWDELVKLRAADVPHRDYEKCFDGHPTICRSSEEADEADDTPDNMSGVSGETADRAIETPDRSGETPDRKGRDTRQIDAPSKGVLTPASQKNTQQQPPEVTGADVGGDSEGTVSERKARMDAAAAALETLGIGEPTRSRLARIPQVTKSLISGEAIKLNGTNKGVGVFIRNIEAKAGQMKQITEKAEKREARDAAQEAEKTGQRQQAGDEAAAIAAENAAVRAVIEAMTPAEIEDLRTEILENCQIGHICKQVRAADCDFRIPGLRPQVLPIVGGRLYAEEPT